MAEGTIATSIAEWFGAGKTVLDTFKSARELLPQGEKRDELDRKLKEAEQLLARSDAKLAHELGYTLCKCTFPPTPMLFKRGQSANVCPSCGESQRVVRAEDFNTASISDYDPLGTFR